MYARTRALTRSCHGVTCRTQLHVCHPHIHGRSPRCPLSVSSKHASHDPPGPQSTQSSLRLNGQHPLRPIRTATAALQLTAA
eukprot:366146-Chlamydomonas_euryale.AAC.10